MRAKRTLNIIFLMLTVFLFSTALAHSASLVEQDNLLKQSPVFYLSIFPSEIKSKEDRYFNRALEYFVQREHELSLEKIQQLLQETPDTKYKEYALYLKSDNEFYATIRDKKTDFTQAANSYQEAIDDFPDSKYAPWAYFQIANCYNRMQFFYEAITKYDEFIGKYQQSEYRELALIYDGELNYRALKYARAINILRDFNDKFPQSKFKALCNFLVADSYYYLEDVVKAAQYFKDAKGIEKKDPQRALRMAEFFIQTKKFKDSIYYLTSIINYFPDFAQMGKTYLLLADSFAELSDFNNAVYNYFYVINNYPDSSEAVEGRLKIAQIGSLIDEKKYKLIMKSSDANFALDLKNVYTEVYRTNKINMYGEKALFELGKIALKQKNDLRAMKIFKKVYDEYPGGVYYEKSFEHFMESFNKLVREYYFQKENIKIVGLYQEYKREIKISKGKDVIDVLFYIGSSLIELKFYSLALEVFMRIEKDAATYKTEDIAYLNAISAYNSMGYALAEKYADKLLSNFKTSKHKNEAERIKAKSVYCLGRHKEAADLLEKYIKKKENEGNATLKVEIYKDIADSYNKIDKPDTAFAYYKKVLDIVKNKKDEASVEEGRAILLKIAGIFYVSKKRTEAIKYYEEYIKDRKLAMEDVEPLFYLAKSYEDKYDFDLALDYFKRLLEITEQGFYANSAKEEISYIDFLTKNNDIL